MSITVTDIVAGPYVATGAAQSLHFAFKVFTPSEVEVIYGSDRTPIDPARYTVTINKAADGQVMEGGSIELSAGAADPGVELRVVAKPAKEQELVFSDTASRLRNLNEGLDRATLRALRTTYDGVFEGAGQEVLDLAEAAGRDGSAQIAVRHDIVQDVGEDGRARARDNMGLGNAATRNVGTALGTVMAADDRRAIGYPTRAALASVSPAAAAAIGQVRVHCRASIGDEYAGAFEWISGNQSANVAADPLSGVWIAPSADASGAAGAWRRVFTGPVDPAWFGGRTSAALQAALNYAKAVVGWLGRQTVRPTGVYQMAATVEYFGNASQGVIFEGRDATFVRSADYGPTFYVRGLADGTALQNTTWVFGPLISQGPMTVANSRCHVLFDHVYFLSWSAPYIREGCGAVHLLGCASWSDLGGIHSWRFHGSYQPGSKGMVIGASELAGSLGLKGGDAHMEALTDIYGGRAVLGLTGSTSGSSTTLVMVSTAGVEVGDIVEGEGWNQGDDPNAVIPNGTTVTAVSGASVTVSTAVNIPVSMPLVFFKPALEDGFVLEAVDGLWVEGFIHSIYCKRRSISLDSGADRGIWNFRLNVMADIAPGVGVYVGGSATLISGLIDVHHLYGGKKTINTAILKDVTVWSPQERWSDNGFRYGGAVTARGLLNDAGDDGYTTVGFRSGGVLRLNHYRAPSGEFGVNVHDASGAYQENAENHNPSTRVSTLRYAQALPNVTVAGLSVFTPTPGAMAYATNARALTLGGTLEGAGAGTGATVVYNGTKWMLAGTNIEAQA